MKSNIPVKDRKKIARLERELNELAELAYKHDLDEDFMVAGEKLNSRYENKYNELKILKSKYKMQ